MGFIKGLLCASLSSGCFKVFSLSKELLAPFIGVDSDICTQIWQPPMLRAFYHSVDTQENQMASGGEFLKLF
jgi:hypothetical protein